MRSVVDRNVVGGAYLYLFSLGTVGHLAGATTHFLLVRGAVSPLPHNRSWRGTYVHVIKRKDNYFCFPFTYGN
jgi:hypothetical protein